MKETEPEIPTPESSTMNEAETLEFLKKIGVEHLGKSWHFGQPVLYVLEEAIRVENGPYYKMQKDQRPTIAILYSPKDIDFKNPDKEEGREIYRLKNDGLVNYYVIDKKTEKPLLVKTTPYSNKDYFVRENTIFKVKDDIFPKI
jgi:hypothetical protein